MNPEVKALWTAALRSGEFTQTRKTLRDESGYCCLGVLCELYRRAHPAEAEWKTSDSLGMPFRAAKGSLWWGTVLPDKVAEWAGFGSHNPANLARVNDDGTPFTQIADIIEERL